MNKNTLLVMLLAGSVFFSACGTRTDEGEADTQPVFNANGELISGGDESTITLGAANPLDALTLRVVSDANSVATGSSDTATITALVTNSDNNAVADANVAFSASAGVLQNVSATTDETGLASATLNLSQTYENQDIVITVSDDTGSVSTVRVVATGSALEVLGPDNLGIGDTALLSIRLTDGSGEPIGNQSVEVISMAANGVSPAALITDSDGSVEVSVSSENFSDTLLISALNGSVSASHSFDVVEDLLAFTNASDGVELAVGGQRVITTNWTRLGQPVVGETLRFSTTVGSIVAPSVVITDSDGNASIQVSSISAGPSIISVEAVTGGTPQTDINVEFVATVPQRVQIRTSDSLVDVNETSTITATVTDALGNRVKNSEVSFSSDDLKGGQLNPASAITDSTGIASVIFTAGGNPTELGGIQISSQVTGTSIEDSLSLSVFKRALNITIGSGNEIEIKPLGTQYALPFVVQVNDGSGTPLEDATVRVTVRPITFLKGFLELVDDNGLNEIQAAAANDDFEADHWGYVDTFIECPSEDADGDRILDTVGTSNEDTNNNGILDPQDPAAVTGIDGDFATLSGGSLQTDVNGSGYFELLYPAGNAAWATVEITARAEALDDEATDTFTAILALPASVANAVGVTPANRVSPYGSIDLNRDVVLNPRLVPVFDGCTSTF